MSDMHNFGPVNKQVNNPIIQGNLVVYGEQKVKRLLTGLPFLEDEIIGRNEVLDSLYDTLESAQRVVLMNGIGGVGKTTAAIAYVNEYKQRYAHIAWIYQVSDFTTDITTNIPLIQNLGVKLTNNPVADTQLILNSLSNLGGKSLLVIDNATEQVKAFKDYLPQAPNWHVLITSRQALPFAKILELGFLSEEDGLRLFYRHYKRDEDDEIIRRILQTIDYHTLTIELLAKTAQKRHIEPLSVLEGLLLERGVKIGRLVNFSIPHSRDDKVERLFSYLKAIFQLDKDMPESEIHLLKQFVGVPPIFVPFDLLTFLLQIDREEEEYDRYTDALDKVTEKGWLIYDPRDNAYKIHRIVQDVLEDVLEPDFIDLKMLVKGVSSILYFDQTKDNPIHRFPLVPFGERLLCIFPDNSEEDFVLFQSYLAIVYQELGRYKEAAELLEKALNSTQNNFGPDHHTVAIRQSDLAIAYQYLGYYEGAAELLEKALTFELNHFGEDHERVGIRQSNLACVYQYLGRNEEAAELLEKALNSAQNNLGSDHPTVAKRQSNLALVYKEFEHYEQAAELLERALSSAQNNFGFDHPIVAKRQSNLAAVYQDLGRNEEAAELLEKALNLTQNNFGEDHPDVAISQWNLANVYLYLNRHQEAFKLLQKAYQTFFNKFGEQHPKTQDIKIWLDLFE